MSWKWLEAPPSPSEPTKLLLTLRELVGRPRGAAPPPRQESFNRVRTAVAAAIATGPVAASRARAGLSAVRHKWKNIAFPVLADYLQKKIAGASDAETRSEYEEHSRIFEDLKERFLAFDGDVLESADTIMKQCASGGSVTPEDFAAQTAFAAPCACGRLDARWAQLRPLCLLSQGMVARMPTAIVDLKKKTTARIDWLECEILRHGSGGCGPHPLQETAFGTRFQLAVHYAWIAALKLAGDPPVTGVWRFETSAESLTGVEGDSAGGALALTFFRALKGQKADRRILVIASISADGELDKVADDGIPAKVLAACMHGGIDTIATVQRHVGPVTACLEEYYASNGKATAEGQRIRVVDIAMAPSAG